jgi:phospholipid transport system transporter-binding protein
LLVLPVQLTHANAQSCLRMLVQGLPAQSESSVSVDAKALENFDSAALAVLIELRSQCLTIGKGMLIHGMPKPLMNLAKLYGIDELLALA